MPKKRIFQVAKELNISHLEIMSFLKDNGVEVATHMSPIEDDIYESILSEFNKERLEIERLRKDKARQAIITNENEIKMDEQVSPKQVDIKEDDKPKKEEGALGLKIIKRPDKEEKEKAQREKSLSTKKEISLENKKNIVDKKPKKRKLKQIDISAIAEKINKPKKEQVKTTVDSSVLNKSLSGQSKKKRKKKKNEEVLDTEVTSNLIKLPEFSTVDELAQTMNVKSQDIIMSCMGLGLMVTINQRLDMDTITMVADEFGFEVETLKEFAEEESFLVDTEEDIKNATERAPIVTVMGHVDHGKTSLLDYLREENVVAGESGGITQHVGAYEVTLESGKKITFLDTPGHQAFTAMRARGANITDIVIIVVAADDDVKPQTVEAIDHAKAAGVPIVVAINKIDRPESNPDKIKKSLSEQNLLVEEWGGKVQCSLISAKTGEGIDDLLDKVLLEAEILSLKANKNTESLGTIVESRLDKGFGPIATVLIQKGTLKKGDIFLCGSQYGRVRAMLNERNNNLDNAFPSDPVQILGFQKVPKAGEIFKVFLDEKDAKRIAAERSILEREASQRRHKKLTLDQIGKQISEGKVRDLDIIIKGDVDGSIEALSDSLMNLSTEEVNVKIIHRSVGMVTENDVSLAAASNAIIIAFNVNTSNEAKMQAKNDGIDIRHYSIIYQAIDEVKLALEGLLEPDKVEEVMGLAEVRDQFKIPKLGIIAGCMVVSGKVVRNAFLRVRRDDEIVHEGKLTSLKRFKDDVNEVLESFECGIGIENMHDFNEKDIIEVYEIKEVKRTL
ncbi:MAG: translation initiation factor IF-2 [Candidatus Marinimicrobia bacterium]|nr:translation initiation factor IF-2 [Candidatus Neomarinimicrobiota bacterium]|tara:strand:- start:6999 stop:9365 length:2367 start_codon:yes stop_codon:yes gene_type:complete